ncbi:MAG: polysaccharide deacetylase family protein [Bacteroidetes bacterium]|nr:MAG: polysaccharide deacetylase family protein [Bacteroidota bacterium]
MTKVTAFLSLFGNAVPQYLINKNYPLPKVSVFYHTIKSNTEPFTKGLYRTITPLQFEKDLDYLLHHFGNRFELSFDDGLSSCAEVAAPILKRKGIQATFFLNTAFIDNKELFYRYKAALIIHACSANPSIQQKVEQQIKKKVVDYVYQVSYRNRHELDGLAQDAEVDFNAYLKQHKPYLNTSQIQKLLADGFNIGAHSIDHPPFFELQEVDQIYQIETSMNWLTERFNLSYKYFSFPFTDWGLSARLFHYIYEKHLVDATWGCAGIKHELFPQHTQRIALDAGYKNAAHAIKTEYLYYQLKRPFNKNTIQRI